jgi:hypothetical protein
MARPRKTLDESRIVELASKGHTNTEIAVFLGVSHDTLERNFAEPLEKGRALRNGRLQTKQFETAMRGDVRMLIWLGKQWLGQREHVEHEREPEVLTVVKSGFLRPQRTLQGMESHAPNVHKLTDGLQANSA